MAISHRMLFGACLVCASAKPAVADADKSKCIEREMRDGHDADTSEAICGIKRFLQNRIRSKPDEEPVEMTVGAPPMISDDTDTPGAGNLEINFVFHAELSREQQAFETPLLDVNYGIGARLQLKYEAPFVIDRSSPAGGPVGTDHGVGDSVVGLKYRFYDDDESGLSLGVYPQVRFHTPGAPRVVSEGGTTFFLPVLLTWEFSHVSITANLAAQKSWQSGSPNYFASFGGGTRLGARVALMAEIAAADLRDAQQQRVIVDLGVKVKLGHKQSAMAAVGHDLRSPADQPSNLYATIAYQALFGH